ncbi:hypothetical protein Y1Q_0012746 [Alligator mississippiensis]|uniref:Uncharacterized protein n=1 Tax=Alligator mississippiensis TaxID=8496 RepID=A0A151PIR6_ALLMI|nr:hypothetical protein Y1Q_0012746 [Alligator mississippiensis]
MCGSVVFGENWLLLVRRRVSEELQHDRSGTWGKRAPRRCCVCNGSLWALRQVCGACSGPLGTAKSPWVTVLVLSRVPARCARLLAARDVSSPGWRHLPRFQVVQKTADEQPEEGRNPRLTSRRERSLKGSWRGRNGSWRRQPGNKKCGSGWAGGRGMFNVCSEKDRWKLLSASTLSHTL